MHCYQIRPKITLKNSIQYQLNLDYFFFLNAYREEQKILILKSSLLGY